MREPSSVRDALISEALGDLDGLLERLESLSPRLLDATDALNDAYDRQQAQLTACREELAALCQKTKIEAGRYIIARGEQAAKRAVDEQVQAMTVAARAVFTAELDPALRRLAGPLNQVVKRIERPWERWLIHAATIFATAGVSWLTAAWLWLR